jgi:hypothetical protein
MILVINTVNDFEFYKLKIYKTLYVDIQKT